MKALITHELFLPDFHGGGEEIVYRMVKGLKENGVDVKVLTTGDPKIKEYDGIKTIRIPLNKFLKFEGSGIYGMNFSLPWVCKYGKDVDLIQTNNYNACLPSYFAGKIIKKPVVCLVHGVYGKRWVNMRGNFMGKFSQIMEKIQVVHDYDKIVFYSDFAKEQGLEIGIPENLTKVIYPGVEYKDWKKGRKEGYVLFVGRLAKQKGLDNLIKVAKELPNVHFKFVGSGEEEERLKSIAPKNVEFVGFKKGGELAELYSKASVFCLPSLAETFGIVILEAMVSGCAVISTVPLPYEGIKVEYGNLKQLKDAIKYLVENPRLTKIMGAKNRKKAKKYTWDNFAKGLIKVYDEILE